MRYFLGFIFLFSVNFVQAREASLVDRPGAVTDTKVFSEMAAFEDFYLKLYKGDFVLTDGEKAISGSDYSVEDDQDRETFSEADKVKIDQQREKAVLGERVRSYPGMENMTNEDVDRMCRGDLTQSQMDHKSVGQQTHFKKVGEARRLCEFEKQNLTRQKNLSQNNNLTSIFVNGTTGDSPFDLVVDLNALDALLFGEKFDDRPKPSFSDMGKSHTRLQRKDYVPYNNNVESHAEGDKTNYPCSGEDKSDEKKYESETEGRKGEVQNNRVLPIQSHCTQQVGQSGEYATLDHPETEDLPRFQSQYSVEDNSIAGHFHGLLPIFHVLNTYSHGAECLATRIFQPPFLNLFIPSTNRLAMRVVKKGGIAQGDTDAEISKQEVGARYFADQEQLITRSSTCEEKALSKGRYMVRSGSDLDRDIDACRRKEEMEEASREQFMSHMTQSDRDDDHFKNLQPVMQNWVSDFEILLDYVQRMEASFLRLSEKEALY